MLKRIAVQKPFTSKPLIMLDANNTTNAFITNVNRPKVRMFIGKVIINNKGFNDILITPKNKATHKALQNPPILTPGIIYEVIRIDKVSISHRNIIYIPLSINTKIDLIQGLLRVRILFDSLDH